MLNELGLFAGIGGISLGLERAGLARPGCFVEIDGYAQRVLQRHWPNVPIWDDVTTFHADEGAFDLITGGFPCQDISIAGRGAGITGSRSGLWGEFHRIIGEVRPRIVLIENVPMLTIRGGCRVIADLAEIGYDAEWGIVSAADVGALHLRKRIFILAYPQDVCRAAVKRKQSDGVLPEVLADTESNGAQRRLQQRQQKSLSGANGNNRKVADAEHERLQACLSEGSTRIQTKRPENDSAKAESGSNGTRTDWWGVEPDVGRVAHGVPSRVDRLKCLGNAVVPQVAEYIGRLILEATAAG